MVSSVTPAAGHVATCRHGATCPILLGAIEALRRNGIFDERAPPERRPAPAGPWRAGPVENETT